LAVADLVGQKVHRVERDVPVFGDRVVGRIEPTRARPRILPPGCWITIRRCRPRDDSADVQIADLTGTVTEGRPSVQPGPDQIVSEHVLDLFDQQPARHGPGFRYPLDWDAHHGRTGRQT
jgi:hypothetical protein